jgi:hypothetical protein
MRYLEDRYGMDGTVVWPPSAGPGSTLKSPALLDDTLAGPKAFGVEKHTQRSQGICVV